MKSKQIYSLLILLPLFFLTGYKSKTTNFWELKNINANAQRINEIKTSVGKCTKVLDEIFTDKPSKLLIIAYGTRSSFVKGLQSEVGFSKEGASYFKKNSAPRPIQGKYLIPPDQELKNVCHEIVHHYLEANTNRENLLNAKWFDEGVATYLADQIFESGDLKRAKEQFQKIPKEKYFPLNYMEKERQWSDLHKNQQSRYFAYNQSGLMVEYFFEKYGVIEFQKILEKMKTSSFKTAFKKTTGITDARYYNIWLKSL